MDYYDEDYFKSRVEKALERVRQILTNNRNPQLPASVPHSYNDKYILASFLSNSLISSLLSTLESMGVREETYLKMKEWSNKKSVSMRLKASEECKFLRKTEREVKSDTKDVTKAGILGKFESYTVTKVTEYFWEFKVKWDLLVFPGVEEEKGIVLQSRTGTVELKTSVESTPKPVSAVRDNIDVNISWLLQHADENRTPAFNIDRDAKTTRTPRRNNEVNDALTFLKSLHAWTLRISSYFNNNVFPEQVNHGLDLSSINGANIFVPVLPLFESSSSSSSSSSAITPTSSSDSSVIPPVFMNSFQAEQVRSLDAKRSELAKVFPANEKLVTIAEAHLLISLLHIRDTCEQYSRGVDYIESLLTKQLVSAIGKEVTPNDFSNYLSYHNRKIFNAQYQPQLFSYAIRRPDHYPEGILSLEAHLDSENTSNPVSTIVAQSKATRPMKFSLNAASSVSFFGDRFLHGYVSHQFAHYSGTSLSLYARARQFSSFILLVGRIVSADLFEPKHAIVIQNKDELKIPLLLETIPTPKEFRDAIESLSPEQQRFCKAFRSMQLESTLFGVCVIQIKPQLEKLLNLPDDSLTKEIKLSQDLLSLFLKYQIPSDLVSFDGPAESSAEDKLKRVKDYTLRMQSMLDNAKKAELEEQQRQQRMRQAELDREAARKRAEEERRLMEERRAMERLSMVEERSIEYEHRSEGIFSRMKNAISAATSTLYSLNEAQSSRSTKSDLSFGSSNAQLMDMDFMMEPVMEESANRSNFDDFTYEPAAKISQPQESQPQPQGSQESKQPQKQEKEISKGEAEGAVVDYTKIPAQMERKFDELDENHALRPTIINVGSTWTKNFQKTLLSEPENTTLHAAEQEKEKNQAFDLLDALTKSGALSVDHAALHIVIASTHCFDKSIMDTLIKDNANPIEKIENSALIVASTIHQTPAINLVNTEHIHRLSQTSPLLITDQ